MTDTNDALRQMRLQNAAKQRLRHKRNLIAALQGELPKCLEEDRPGMEKHIAKVQAQYEAGLKRYRDVYGEQYRNGDEIDKK